TQTIRRALEDLQALEVVDCQKGGQGVADRWTLRDEWVSIFRQIGAAPSVAEDGLSLEALVGDVLVAEEPGPEARNGHAAIAPDAYYRDRDRDRDLPEPTAPTPAPLPWNEDAAGALSGFIDTQCLRAATAGVPLQAFTRAYTTYCTRAGFAMLDEE